MKKVITTTQVICTCEFCKEECNEGDGDIENEFGLVGVDYIQWKWKLQLNIPHYPTENIVCTKCRNKALRDYAIRNLDLKPN